MLPRLILAATSYADDSPAINIAPVIMTAAHFSAISPHFMVVIPARDLQTLSVLSRAPTICFATTISLGFNNNSQPTTALHDFCQRLCFVNHVRLCDHAAFDDAVASLFSGQNCVVNSSTTLHLGFSVACSPSALTAALISTPSQQVQRQLATMLLTSSGETKIISSCVEAAMSFMSHSLFVTRQLETETIFVFAKCLARLAQSKQSPRWVFTDNNLAAVRGLSELLVEHRRNSEVVIALMYLVVATIDSCCLELLEDDLLVSVIAEVLVDSVVVAATDSSSSDATTTTTTTTMTVIERLCDMLTSIVNGLQATLPAEIVSRVATLEIITAMHRALEWLLDSTPNSSSSALPLESLLVCLCTMLKCAAGASVENASDLVERLVSSGIAAKLCSEQLLRSPRLTISALKLQLALRLLRYLVAYANEGTLLRLVNDEEFCAAGIALDVLTTVLSLDQTSSTENKATKLLLVTHCVDLLKSVQRQCQQQQQEEQRLVRVRSAVDDLIASGIVPAKGALMKATLELRDLVDNAC